MRPARLTVSCTGVAARQPSCGSAGTAMGADRLDRGCLVHGPSIDREDPIAERERAIGWLALLDRRHGVLGTRVWIEGLRFSSVATPARLPEKRIAQNKQEGDQQVDAGAGEDHRDALPRRLVVVGARRHLRLEPLEFLRAHPGDLHEPPRGDRADHVFGLPLAHPHDLRREEQREALHAHPHGLGHGEVPELVQDDRARRCRGS